MKKIIIFFKYWLIFIEYHMRYNRWMNAFQVRWNLNSVTKKLMKKGYSTEKIIGIMERYGRKLQYDTRNSYVELNETIAKISDKTGVEQWQIRDQLRRDFNIDI